MIVTSYGRSKNLWRRNKETNRSKNNRSKRNNRISKNRNDREKLRGIGNTMRNTSRYIQWPKNPGKVRAQREPNWPHQNRNPTIQNWETPKTKYTNIAATQGACKPFNSKRGSCAIGSKKNDKLLQAILKIQNRHQSCCQKKTSLKRHSPCLTNKHY